MTSIGPTAKENFALEHKKEEAPASSSNGTKCEKKVFEWLGFLKMP